MTTRTQKSSFLMSALVLATVMGWASCTDRGQSGREETAPQEPTGEIMPGEPQSGETGSTDWKQGFQQRFDEIQGEIQQLEAKAEQRTGEAKENLEQSLEPIKSEASQISTKLEQSAQSTGEEASRLRADLEQSISGLEQRVDQLMTETI